MPCKDMMIKCIWGGKEKDCCHLFKPIITLSGQCYVFNMLPGQLLYADYTYVYSVELSPCIICNIKSLRILNHTNYCVYNKYLRK